MSANDGPHWGLLAVVAAPFCCGGLAWLAAASLTTGVLLAAAGWAAMAVLAAALAVGLVFWSKRSRKAHGP